MRRFLAILAALAALSTIVSCGNDNATSESNDTGAGSGGSITVFAAASLTDAFAEVAEAFEAETGVSVELSFAGSSALREQILDGAPADVFASANQSTMDRVIDAGEIDEVRVFATNSLQIVVPAGNPAGIEGIEDFANESLFIGLCAAEVPCGDFGRRALETAGITAAPDTNEPDVRALLTKVSADELDAGIVYATDVTAEGDAVEGIDIPSRFNVIAGYPIGTVTASNNPLAAAAFVDFVLSDAGAEILRSYGFASP